MNDIESAVAVKFKRIQHLVTIDYCGPDDQTVGLSIRIALTPLYFSPCMHLVSIINLP